MARAAESVSAVIKAYDVRGVVGEQIDEEFVREVGASFARLLRSEGSADRVVIGHDMRASSPSLSQAFADGVTAQGLDVVLIGLASTDQLYFASGLLDAPGAMFTASHNPAKYNGIKLCRAGAKPVGQDTGLAQISADLVEGVPAYDGERGNITEQDVLEDYASFVRGLVDLAEMRPLKVAVDAGNGMGGHTVPAVFGALPVDLVPLYFELDGTFPNHEANPLDPANLVDLQRLVVESGADVGLAFDGDGDRLGVVTKSGQIIWPDRQLVLFARDVLERNPGATIIYDVKCSRHVGLSVEAAGGAALMWKTGHSLVKAKLAETGAPLAGEMSGHIFFKERWYGFDDGLYTGARLLEIVSRAADACAPLEALPQDVSTPELKLEMEEGQPFTLVKSLQEQGQFPDAKRVITIDGVRAEYADGFGLARPSNTTPVVVLRFEAQSEAALARIQADFRRELGKLAPNATLPF